jgi:hypothetical protein
MEYFGVCEKLFGYFVLISFRRYDGIPTPKTTCWKNLLLRRFNFERRRSQRPSMSAFLHPSALMNWRIVTNLILVNLLLAHWQNQRS